MSLITDYQSRIDQFLENLLSYEIEHTKKIQSKIIHDSVWGTNLFYPWEVALIDSPLLQRLRRIHQTGLAYLVYPTATHTRFEHSLGVTILVDRLINHLNKNVGKELISKNELYGLRLSALLHDIGHSFYSHVSERIYARIKNYNDFRDEIEEEYGVNPNGHEIFAFLMIRSEIFKEYFKGLINNIKIEPDAEEFIRDINWEIIGSHIIGYSPDREKKFLSDIINGPIDCDKLDYLARDAKFAGPVIVYDIDRFFYTIDTIMINDHKRLTVIISGTTALEQILISRMMMFSYIYHHHKVRAAEAMIKRLCFNIMHESDKNVEDYPFIKLEHPIDFLQYTDETILNSLIDYYQNCDKSKKIIKDLLNRNLWIRAQMVSSFNIEEEDLNIEFKQIENDLYDESNIEELKRIKNMIIKKVKKFDPSVDINEEDIWIDTPPPPTVDQETENLAIKKNRKIEQSIPLMDIVPLDHWITAYDINKWRAHIFCKRQFQELVYRASKDVLKSEYSITISKITEAFCKIN